MRIALVAEDYYPQLGGVPEHVHNQALQLLDWGHDVTVVTSQMAGAGPDPEHVQRVGTSRVIYANGGVARITTGWRLGRQLETGFRAGRFAVVDRHGGLHAAFRILGPRAALPPSPPRVATV